MDPMHPYEHLSLFTIGLILGVWLIGSHALMLAKPAMVQGFLKKFPRDPVMVKSCSGSASRGSGC